MPHRFTLIILSVFAAVLVARTAALAERPRWQGEHDFLSPGEAEKVRDAQSASDRARLFIAFAEDRLKKFEYELQLKGPQMNRVEMLNGLLKAYTDCIDEASDRIDDGRQSELDMRPAIKEMQKKAAEYLATLNKIQTAGSRYAANYKDSLGDAIADTQDALRDVKKAAKEYGSVPVRRKPH